MNQITEDLLKIVSDWNGIPDAAYNIREDTGCAGRRSTEHIQIDSKEDLPGINISPDRVTAFWDAQVSQRLNLHLQASHAFDRDFERLGTPVASFEGYTTVDALARIALPVGTLNVGVENLLGEQYVTFYSQTSPRNDSYTAGRGRVLTLGWSQRF